MVNVGTNQIAGNKRSQQCCHKI